MVRMSTLERQKMADRREHIRWLLDTNFETYNDEKDRLLGYMADLSIGGIRLVNKEPIQTNIIMPIRISLKKEIESSKEMRVMTRVVRCQKDLESESYDIGFRLIDLSTENRDIISQLVKLHKPDNTD